MRTPLSVLCMLLLAVMTAHTLSAVAQTGPGSGSPGGAAGGNINSAGGVNSASTPIQGANPTTSPSANVGTGSQIHSNTGGSKNTGVNAGIDSSVGVYNGKAGVDASTSSNLRRQNMPNANRPFGNREVQTGTGMNVQIQPSTGTPSTTTQGGTMNPSAPVMH
ncbi:MAG: hypothetical protein VKJ04_07195 [Vampirovibrionales bacterium]|nr:hypothetical protein [Vampirovibrionales bacterium]